MAARHKQQKRRAWSEEGERSLRSLVRQKIPARRIARTFRRTEGAVRQKVASLGISWHRTR